MFTSLICSSFHEQEMEGDGTLIGVVSPSRRSIRKSGAKSRSFVRRCLSYKGRGENPYSTVGLDKFSALLSDLEEKKKNIYLQKDSRDIMFVRFVYSGSEEVVPVIVKSKDKKQTRRAVAQKKDELRSRNGANKPGCPEAEQATEASDEKIVTGVQKRRMIWEMSKKKLGRPYYYIPIFVVVILLLLAIFGRSFAILCASMGWYLVPIFAGMTDETASPTSATGCMKEGEKKTTGAISRATSPKGK